MKKWTFFWHLGFSAIVAIVFNYLWPFFRAREAASIGIIGGADGPTVIFLSGNSSGSSLATWVVELLLNALPGLCAFGIMVLGYPLLKKAFNR